MWVRRFVDTNVVNVAGEEANELVNGAYYYSSPVRVLGGSAASFVLLASSSLPLDSTTNVLISHSQSPSFQGNTTDWISPGVGQGIGSSFPAHSLYDPSSGGGFHVQCYPLGPGTTYPAGGVPFTAEWARLQVRHLNVANLTLTSVTSSVFYEGEASPRVFSGTGAISRHQRVVAKCYAGLGNTYLTSSEGKSFDWLKVGAMVEYQDGLPLAGLSKPLFVKEVSTDKTYFRMVAGNANSPTLLTNPTTFATKDIVFYNLVGAASGDTL